MIVQGNNPYFQPSFSFFNRLARFVWGIVWALFFFPSPRSFHGWRSLLLRAFGAKIGDHVHVYPSVRVWAPWNLRIGSYVGVGDRAILYSMADINISDYAVISQGVHLCTGTHDYNSPNFQLVVSPIEIGSRVWLCAEAFVGPGVKVCEGNVIAARSVVARSVESFWGVWAGVPIKKIGERNKSGVLNE